MRCGILLSELTIPKIMILGKILAPIPERGQKGVIFMCKQLVVIQSDDPLEFEKAFNAKLRELEQCEPEYEFHHGAGYCAYIIYSDNSDLSGIVDTTFRFLCDTCLKCVEPPYSRVKWRRCGIFGTIDGKKHCDHYLEREVM